MGSPPVKGPAAIGETVSDPGRVEPEPPTGSREGYPEHRGSWPRPIAHRIASGEDPNTNRIRGKLKHGHPISCHRQHARSQVGGAEVVHRALYGETIQGVLKAGRDEAGGNGQERHSY